MSKVSNKNRADIAAMIEGSPVQTYRTYCNGLAGWLEHIPAHCQPGLVRYVILGIRPGSFLCAVLAGERELAERRADDINRPRLERYADFLQHGMPPNSAGSPKLVQAWCERGGLIGRPRAET